MTPRLIAVCLVFCCSVLVGGEDAESNEEFLQAGGRSLENSELKFGKVPYMVSLHDTRGFICGGVIISSFHILTSADCAEYRDARNLAVRVGSIWNGGSGIVYNITEMKIHPMYNGSKLDYDVAVLRTTEPIVFRKREVEAIPLGDVQPPVGASLLIAGWGAVKTPGDPQKQLRFARVNLTDQESCEGKYRESFAVTPRMFCTDAREKGVCSGDEGGPAVYDSKLVGVIMRRFACELREYPDLYARIADPDIRGFITKVMEGS